MGVCNCSMFCCTLLYVHFSIAIILMGKRELIALLNLSSWCLVMVERLFLTVPRGCLQFVIVVFPDHTHLLLEAHHIFFKCFRYKLLKTHMKELLFQMSSFIKKLADNKNIKNKIPACKELRIKNKSKRTLKLDTLNLQLTLF